MGRLSYPLYLIHWPVFRMQRGAETMLHISLSPWFILAVGVVLSVIVAEILLVGFDEPTRRWLTLQLRRHLARLHSPMAATGPTIV